MTSLSDDLDNTSNDRSSNIVEHSFDPVDQCDLTIHFKDHAFHVHSLILGRASAYFNTAIQGSKSSSDSSCSLLSDCTRLGHSCVNLLDSLGGQDYSTDHMKIFLECLYDPSLVFPTKTPNRLIIQPAYLKFEFSDSAKYLFHFTINSNEPSVGKRLGTDIKPTGNIHIMNQTAQSIESRGTSRLNFFVDQHRQTVFLAHYFDCQSLLKMFELFCASAVEEAILIKEYDVMWRFVLVADFCKWNMLSRLIDTLAADPSPKYRPGWIAAVKAFKEGKCSPSTCARIYESLCLQ